MRDQSWTRAYRTPLALLAMFVALLIVFAVTPDPTSGEATDIAPTSEPTAGPDSCPICGIDQECDPSSGQCMFIDHTPPPCIKSANYDEGAGMCLPEGVVAPPAAPAATSDGRTRFPRGIRSDRGSRVEQPDLPGFGD
jgi:hypothetical protein